MQFKRRSCCGILFSLICDEDFSEGFECKTVLSRLYCDLKFKEIIVNFLDLFKFLLINCYLNFYNS